MWNKDLQKSVMSFGSLTRFYWNHCIAITCVFKLAIYKDQIKISYEYETSAQFTTARNELENVYRSAWNQL